MVTALDRSVQDTVRIAKWMASPKGLLWVVKQIGLGLTNPKVEAIGGAFTRQTRIHSGVASLLSVPTAAFGLHFTRHGIPFLNETASYENVIKFKQTLSVTKPYSRLISLKDELIGKTASGATGPLSWLNKVQTVLRAVNGFKGAPILSLSGLAGPGSVYGIGTTTISRYVNTNVDSIERAGNYKFNPKYSIGLQYAAVLSSKDGLSTKSDDTLKENARYTDLPKSETAGAYPKLKAKPKSFSSTPAFGSVEYKLQNSEKFKATVDLSSAESRNNSGFDTAVTTGINGYATMAYGKIPKQKLATGFNDFRNDVSKQTTDQNKNYVGVNSEVQDYHKDYNLEKKYGMGNLGEVGKDRSKPYTFLIKGTQFGTANRAILSGDTRFKGDKINALDVKKNSGGGDPYPANHKDFIKFYFEDGTQGNNIIVFRATMTGFSDSFTPGWDRIDIMGRPDGAYLYNSFERTISFNFMVAATTRSEMIPMWRKLNYLASYTMPDFIGGNRPSGPMMRFTIGDLFSRTPGFITSLNYTIPDDATWDIAEDKESSAPSKDDSKELPMVVEVALSATIVGDFRPQLMGRTYSLSPGGAAGSMAGQWLPDAER
jgi:hypothetical protein